MPRGLKFNDPWGDLGQDERIHLEENADEMFAKLDALWASGDLPQRFSGIQQ
jgi:hypothetical protein